MTSAAASPHLPWQKLGLTALVAAGYAFFWINGPLQERQPVFEFEEHMTGFAEPVRFGEETQTARSGLTAAREEHLHFHIMTAKKKSRRSHKTKKRLAIKHAMLAKKSTKKRG